MYSQAVTDIFKKSGVSIGDKVEVSGNGKTYIGILMPKAELGNPDVIVIKLDSGYNIGVSSKSMSIKKLSGKAKLGSSPKMDITPRDDLPPISILATGGTVASRVDYVTGGVSMAMTPQEILFSVRELADMVSLRNVKLLFNLASEDMGYKQWQQMAEETASELNSGSIGVVITHGTDTMHYSSAALSFMLDTKKPVIFTGAQRSSDRGSSDASLNIICSSIAAKSEFGGVGVCMHGSTSDDYCLLNSGVHVRKMHTTRRDTFRPINSLPFAKIWKDGRFEGVSDIPSREEGKVKVDTRFEPKVALIKVHPNSDPSIIDYYLSEGYRGFVIEATGMGHVPTSTSDPEKSWISHIKKATDSGVPVVFTPQPPYGRLNMYVYKNQRLALGAGAIDGVNMLSEVAYVKLGCMLGRERKYEKVRELMTQNIIGEITTRTDHREFLY